MADITKLRRQRSYIKGKLTRIEQALAPFQGQAATALDKEEAEVQLERLDQVIREFQGIQQQIIQEIDEPSVADVTAEAEFEERSLAVRAFLRRSINASSDRASDQDSMLVQLLQRQMTMMEKYEANGSVQVRTSLGTSEVGDDDSLGNLLRAQTEILQRLSESNGSAVGNCVKLPTLKLPSFDGKIEDWTRFSDAFTKTIHANQKLADIQKFNYLLSCVSGAAARAIEDVELSDDNYSVAWELLQKRFEDPKVVKRRHVQCLFEMPTVERESASAILQLVDHVNKHMRVLKKLGSPTDSWDELIIYMMELKLDPGTKRAWEDRVNIKADIRDEGNMQLSESTLNDLMDFLMQRYHTLERNECGKASTKRDSGKSAAKDQGQVRGQSKVNSVRANGSERVTSLASSVKGACFMCNDSHALYNCSKFLAMKPEERNKEVRRLKLCLNCLRNDHFVKNCKHGSCRECASKHNTLLHQADSKEGLAASPAAEVVAKDTTTKTVCHSSSASRCSVLMATAIVDASNQDGYSSPIRVLLDSGSEANFITQGACNRLGLKRRVTSEIIAGVNNVESQVRQCTNVVLKSRHANFQFNAQRLIIPKIARDLPSREIDKEALSIPPNLRLADHDFNKRNSIDLLIGAEFFYELLANGKIDLGTNNPFLQNTKLGWVVAGPIYKSEGSEATKPRELNVLHCSLREHEDLDKTLKQFWEIESVMEAPGNAWSTEETACERMYVETTMRDQQGRFVVNLPFKSTCTQIGDTRDIALRRLNQIERRFTKDKSYYERYVQFMREYLDMQHMSLVESHDNNNDKNIIYLPHHGVLKETSSTTKLRVVFDASSKGSAGASLNDTLMIGPTLQDNLISILIRFRFYNIAIIGDLEKMYRQILIQDRERDCQRILWRFSMNDPVQEYRLNTLTYGQASASYLAIRSIRQLAEENKDNFPLASKCVLSDMYVDDIISGAQDLEEAKALQLQMTELMSKGCFKVHKWHSSDASILPSSDPQGSVLGVNLKASPESIRTLGLVWEPSEDAFIFTISFKKEVHSKRELLSEISKLFDPLGLLGPVITLAKLLMQETWRENVDWDARLPDHILARWEKLRSELSTSTVFCIPRRISSKYIPNELTLYGFCDASQNAYGACVYVKVRDKDGQTTRLLCSKSRVAPIKTISIPRLELCGALLLARLTEQIKQACKFEFHRIMAFTDSTIVLYWLKGDVSRWKMFVAKRVSEITSILPADTWAHVKSEDNPADLLSRGAFPSILQNCELWWEGPHWMSKDESDIRHPSELPEVQDSEIVDIRSEERPSKTVCHYATAQESIIHDLYSKSSNLSKTERVLAYCLRFIRCCQSNYRQQDRCLIPDEIEEARLHLIKNAQEEVFSEEIAALRQGKNLKSSSKLLALHPFLDDKGLLRVGGRLRHAPLPFNQTHPILLPSHHTLTNLLIEREHKRLLHSGPQALLASIRRKYWPLRGRDVVRRICRSCIWCARTRPYSSQQLMGDLPADRVTPTRPFLHCGIDFAGPIVTLVNKGRGRKTNKSYIALFICFSTKAIHLEAVSDLSTETFMAALKRFIGRRGCPLKIYSDNATNFKGAQREIKEIHVFLREQAKGPLSTDVTTSEIQWIFIPPYSPHCGSLWEAGIKSAKNLLRNIMGNSLFTYEELSTALIQVEACLNSRPLYALSDDPSDLEPLTPGHFLTGGPITHLPEVNLQDINIHRLNRWQLLQRAVQDFWKRWAAEYVSSLQGRSKWKGTRQNLRIGDLVILRDEHAPPYQWKLGRVVEVHRGPDELVRVVSVKTASGVTKRTINKLCKLPISDSREDYY